MLHKLLYLTAALASLAGAHATLKTDTGGSESLAGKYETYRLQVPTEKDIATTEVRLLIPAGLGVSNFMPLPGFARSTEKDATGAIRAVVWKGRIEQGEFQRFLFSARNPAEAGALTWKVYQKYADGSVVSWDNSDPSTPASQTTVK